MDHTLFRRSLHVGIWILVIWIPPSPHTHTHTHTHTCKMQIRVWVFWSRFFCLNFYICNLVVQIPPPPARQNFPNFCQRKNAGGSEFFQNVDNQSFEDTNGNADDPSCCKQNEDEDLNKTRVKTGISLGVENVDDPSCENLDDLSFEKADEKVDCLSFENMDETPWTVNGAENLDDPSFENADENPHGPSFVNAGDLSF